MQAFFVSVLVVACAGCTALTDFDRFHAAELAQVEDDAGESTLDASAPELDGSTESDAAPELDAATAEDAQVSEADASTAEDASVAPGPLAGTWQVMRTLIASTCTPTPATTLRADWTFTDRGGLLRMQYLDPTGADASIEGVRTGSTFTAGSVSTLHLSGTVDGASFEATETSGAQSSDGSACQVTRRVTGVRVN